MKKIAVIGSTLTGNKGAAAMLESSIQTLGLDKEFFLFTYQPVKEELKHNTYKNLTILRADALFLGVVINLLALIYKILPPLRGLLRGHSKSIRTLAEADVLLDQGGITFVDGREKFLLYNIASILPALMVGTPVIKCSQALGPFNNPINKFFAKIFLPKMKAIVSRGSITQKYLDQLGLKNTIEGADYAFLLELTNEEKKSAKKYYKEDFFNNNKVVGISPSVVMQKKVEKQGKDYSKIITKFIDSLMSNGYRVVLLPHSVRLGTEKTHNNDLPLCREIYKNLNNSKECLFIKDELSSQELRAIIGKCDLFVASRFHAMISSLAMSVPTLVIGWSHKYKEVLEMFNLEEWAFGQDKLSQDYLSQRFKELEKEQEGVKGKIKKHLPEVKKRSYKQVAAIESILKK